MKKTNAFVLSLFVFAALSFSAHADTLFWSANGTGLGGVGTWDGTTANRFGSSASGPFNLTWNNANGDIAVFSTNFAGGSPTIGAITPSTVTAGGLIITNSTAAAYSFGGSSTITLTGPTPTIFLDGTNNANATTNTVNITCIVSCAGTLVKNGGGRVNFNNNSSSIAKIIVNGGGINTGNNSLASPINAILGATPATVTSDNITLNGAGLSFSAVSSQSSHSTGPNRGIVLGANGGWLGSASATAVVTVAGPISGVGDLIFPGSTEWTGQLLANIGIFSITNQNNSYQGQTRISATEVRLGNHQVLPSTTTVNVTNSIGSSGTGKLNLFGFTNRVAKVILDSTGASQIIDTVGNGKLYATEVDLRTTTAAVGVSNAVFAGTGMLRKTTSGTVAINSTNIYTGDTRIEGGTLVLTNNGTVSGSFDNSANIAIYAGATLKVTNRLDGKLTIGAAQNLSGSGAIHGPVVLKGNVAPGANGYVGTLNVVGNQTWDAGSKYTWDINQAAGTAGVDPGWDQLNITGGLTITASQANPMTIYVTSRDLANALGSVSDFNNTTTYTWSIAKTTTGITGFDTNAFVVNTSGFSNPLDATGGFSVTTNSTDVLLVYSLRTTQTVNFDPISNKNYGDAFATSATASSGLPITYSIVSGPATVSGSTVTVTGVGSVTVRAAQAGNSTYAPASADQTFSAAPSPLTVSAVAVSRAYGSSNPSFTATYSGFKLSETLGTSDVTGAPGLSTSASASSVPGNYAITVSANTLNSSHYALSYSDGTLTVTQAVLTVTADDKTRPYNTANPTFSYVITGYVLGENSGVVSGTPTLSTTATISSNPGQYAITATQGSLSAANYSFAFVNGTLTISGFPLTVTVVSTNRVYGDANPAFTVTYSGFVESDDASVVSGTPGFTTTATGTSTVAGGPYTVTASVGTLTAARYSFTTFVDGQLTITKRPLTVTGVNTSRTYGATNPTFTASYSGFVNSDTSSVVRGSAVLSTSATATSTVAAGPYPITPSLGTLDADNYSFASFVDGQLTITPAPLSVTADNKVRAVGAADPTFTGVISASQNGDAFSATYATAADVNSPIGTYAIVPTLVDPDSKAGNYNVTLNNGTLIVTNDPTVIAQPTSRTNIAGTTATFSVSVSTASSVQYQWQKGGANIANATDSVLTLLNVSQADAASYSVVVSNAIGTATSSNAKLTVIDPIVITSGPANATVTYGTLGTFTVTVTGTSPKYQWQKDGLNLTNSTRILGATTATLSITNAIPSDFGNYSVVVTNLAGAVTSGTATLSLSDPGIVTQPASRTNNVGDVAQFTVSAGGSSTLTYQWKFNGNNIADATNSVAIIPVAGSGSAGSYSVVVTGNGSITSSDAVLSVSFASRTKFTQWNFNSTTPDNNVVTGVTSPSIGAGTLSIAGAANNNWNTGSSSDPAPIADNSSRRWDSLAGTAVNKTAGAKYSVSTIGYKNIAFSGELWLASRSSGYWRGQYSTNNGVDWVDRAVINRRGANLAGFYYFADDLTGVPGVNNNSNFAYRVVAEYESTATGSGSAAYVSSDPTTTFNSSSSLFGWDMVTVLGDAFTPPVVQTSPASQTKTAGETVVFSASASGPSVSVIWTKNGNNIGSGTVSTAGGVTTSTLSIDNVHLSDAGDYVATFSNVDASGVNSSSATLTVNPASLIINSDSATIVYGDANPVFTGNTSGLLPGDAITISYATVADVFSAVGGYEITQSIDDPNGVLVNYTITTNNGALTISTAPLSVSADNKVKATGAVNPSLTGVVLGLKNSDNITGVFATVATDESVAGDYTITAGINDPDGKAGNYNIALNNGTLSIVDLPAITSQPADLTKDAGENAVFSVGATGASLGYQWYKNSVPLANAGEFSGALSSSLTVASVTLDDSGTYSVVITNAVGSVTSANATLSVQSAPAITVQPISLTNNAGTSATFSVNTTGAGPLAYFWSHDGSPVSDDANVSGSGTATLTISDLLRANSGDYSVVVSNAFGTATSTVATLAVIDPAIISDPVGVTINGGETHVFSVIAAGTPTLKYQWYSSNLVSQAITKLTGKTTSTLTIGPATDASGAGYFCVVSNGLTAPNVVTSAVAVLVVYTHSELIINTDHGSGTGSIAHVGTTKYGTVANHAVLEVGRAYTMKATPSSGCIFSNWTDGNGNVLTNVSTLKNFIMQSNLVINANFMTNAVLMGNVTGKYNGLFYEEVGSEPDIKVASAGVLTSFSVKSKAMNGPGGKTVGYGPISGSISVDGLVKPVGGILDLDGNLKKSVKLDSVIISRSKQGKPDLLVNLHVDWIGGTRQVTGTISNMTASGWVSYVRADLAASAGTTRYTMAIDHGTNTTETPGGYGFGTVSGKSSGMLSLVGKVADGQTISQSIAPDIHGKWPLYAKLYNNGGLLLGWLDMNGGAPAGNVTWIKPAGWSSSKNINYVGGFTTTVAVGGSVYNAPAVGSRILPSDSNNFIVTATDIGSGLDSTLSWTVNLTTANKFVILPGSATNTLTLTAKAPTGEIGMKFRPTGAGTTSDKLVTGVVLQASTNMFGAFQNAGTIGGVTVQPAP